MVPSRLHSVRIHGWLEGYHAHCDVYVYCGFLFFVLCYDFPLMHYRYVFCMSMG